MWDHDKNTELASLPNASEWKPELEDCTAAIYKRHRPFNLSPFSGALSSLPGTMYRIEIWRLDLYFLYRILSPCFGTEPERVQIGIFRGRVYNTRLKWSVSGTLFHLIWGVHCIHNQPLSQQYRLDSLGAGCMTQDWNCLLGLLPGLDPLSCMAYAMVM